MGEEASAASIPHVITQLRVVLSLPSSLDYFLRAYHLLIYDPRLVYSQPSYHSTFNELAEEGGVRVACNMAILPLRTAARGPAPIAGAGAESF